MLLNTIVSSATRFTMPKTPFPSVIQRMIYCQIGSSERVFRVRPGLRRVSVFGNDYHIVI